MAQRLRPAPARAMRHAGTMTRRPRPIRRWLMIADGPAISADGRAITAEDRCSTVTRRRRFLTFRLIVQTSYKRSQLDIDRKAYSDYPGRAPRPTTGLRTA